MIANLLVLPSVPDAVTKIVAVGPGRGEIAPTIIHVSFHLKRSFAANL